MLAKKKSMGFSLIEILVVAVVVAMLIGLLLPAIGRARRAAQQARGLSNVRQWVLAFTMYADDHNGRFPTEGQTSGGVDLDDGRAWFNALPPYVNETPLNQHEDVYGKMPRPGDNSIFMCPALRLSDLHASPSDGEAVFAYAYNLWIEHDGEQPLRWQNIEHYASRFAVIGERGPTDDNPASTRFANMDERHIAYRHRAESETLIGFADGHARAFIEEDVGTIVWNPGEQ